MSTSLYDMLAPATSLEFIVWTPCSGGGNWAKVFSKRTAAPAASDSSSSSSSIGYLGKGRDVKRRNVLGGARILIAYENIYCTCRQNQRALAGGIVGRGDNSIPVGSHETNRVGEHVVPVLRPTPSNPVI
jgi:hypothetical protein